LTYPADFVPEDRARAAHTNGVGEAVREADMRQPQDENPERTGKWGRRRRSRWTKQRPPSRRSSALVLGTAAVALALTVPALAESGDWNVFTALGLSKGLSSDQSESISLMPFETAGESFPGSAFYYLEETPRLAFDLEELRSEEVAATQDIAIDEGGSTELLNVDPTEAAMSFQSAGTGIDKARALQCLSMAVYYEAASESYAGQRAVAQVVLNRVAHPAYPASVCGVVFQGSERRTGCQFTFTCDGSLKRQPARRSWAVAQSVALAALAGSVFTEVGTATHYHTTYVNPYWAPSLDHIGTIGLHRFYRWKGRAGKPDAFSITYRGGEPAAAAKARTAASAPAVITGPSFLPKDEFIPAGQEAPSANGGALAADAAGAAGTASIDALPPASAAAPTPPATQDNLPQSGTVKEEYRRSGQWIREPGK
jgi:hypothetical protein